MNRERFTWDALAERAEESLRADLRNVLMESDPDDFLFGLAEREAGDLSLEEGTDLMYDDLDMASQALREFGVSEARDLLQVIALSADSFVVNHLRERLNEITDEINEWRGDVAMALDEDLRRDDLAEEFAALSDVDTLDHMMDDDGNDVDARGFAARYDAEHPTLEV